MASIESCPTCGATVTIHTSGEGTSYYVPEVERLRDERDRAVETRENANRAHMRQVRLFNRLEAAVSHHKAATDKQGFTENFDDALYKARDSILRDAHERKG